MKGKTVATGGFSNWILSELVRLMSSADSQFSSGSPTESFLVYALTNVLEILYEVNYMESKVI